MFGRYLLATVAATALLIGEARADSTVAAMTAAAALSGAELFYCVQTAADRNCTANQLKTFVTASGVVTSVGFSVPATSIFTATGSPVTGAGTLGFTTAGTSGGIPYFSSAAALSSSAVLAANGVVIGGGAGVAPVSTAAGGANTFFMGSAGAPSFATAAAATAALGLFSTSTTAQGLVPGSNGAAATSFLNATGAWSVPAGGSGGVTIGATITGSCTSGFNLYSNAGVIGCQANGGGGLPLVGTGATYTTNTPLLDLSQTWNGSGVTFQAIRLNVTNTLSAAGSKLIDLQLGGNVAFQWATTTAAGYPGIIVGDGLGNTGAVGVLSGGRLQFNSSPVYFGQISPNTIALDSGSGDTILARDAAGILALRNSNSAIAATARVYNTFTDASNYERAVVDWTTVANTLVMGAQFLGTGQARQVNIAAPLHLNYTSGTPTANSCAGFALTTGSSDVAGKVAFTSATSCSITFANAFTNAPFCVVSPGSAASTHDAVTSTTGLAVTFGTANTSMQWHCFGS